jgi:hypothetical protein
VGRRFVEHLDGTGQILEVNVGEEQHQHPALPA